MSEFDDLKKWIENTRDQPLEKMESFFDVRVGDYEEHMLPYWKRVYEWMGKLVPTEAETLLDIGCGTGLELDEIFCNCPNIEVTGIDLSAKMLSKLKEKHLDKKINTIQGDYFVEELGESKFDVAVSFQTLHHFTPIKKQRLFEKIYRSLKPSGIYLEADYVADNNEWEEYLFEELARRKKQWSIGEETWVHFDTPLTLEHEIECMKQAGFDDVKSLGFLEGDGTPMIIAKKL